MLLAQAIASFEPLDRAEGAPFDVMAAALQEAGG